MYLAYLFHIQQLYVYFNISNQVHDITRSSSSRIVSSRIKYIDGIPSDISWIVKISTMNLSIAFEGTSTFSCELVFVQFRESGQVAGGCFESQGWDRVFICSGSWKFLTGCHDRAPENNAGPLSNSEHKSSSYISLGSLPSVSGWERSPPSEFLVDRIWQRTTVQLSSRLQPLFMALPPMLSLPGNKLVPRCTWK